MARKRTRSQTGRGSKRKGARGELAAAEVLRPIFPDVRRKAMQARGGSEGADLENTPGYHVEVGIGKAVSAHAKWEQAREDSRLACHCADKEHPVGSICADVVPIALTRRDRGTWLVTMSAEAFVELVRNARRTQQDGQGGTQRGEGEHWDHSDPRLGVGCPHPDCVRARPPSGKS